MSTSPESLRGSTSFSFSSARAVALVCAAATAAAACGGTNAASVVGAADGGEADAAAAPSATPPSGSTDPADGGTSKLDASAPGDGAVPDAASAPDTRLDPIEVGHAWTYNVNVLGFYPSCENGIGVATTLSKGTKGGKTAFQVQSLCKNAGTYDYAVDGDKVYYWFDGDWRLATDTPVQAGHTWNDDTYDYVWEDAGTQVTPAGTFTSCWTARRDVSWDSYTTFCRGIGPVHWHWEDGLGNGYDAILTNKNF